MASGSCPLCSRAFSHADLEAHVNTCLDLGELESRKVAHIREEPRPVKSLSEFRAKLSSKSCTKPVIPPSHGPCSEIYKTLSTPRGFAIPHFKTLIYTRYAVDAFRWGPLQDCTGYFLTHFHSDHYDGLNSSWSCQVPIYCSQTTASLATLRLGVQPSSLVVLQMNVWIDLSDVKVMLLDANHCPGSVILLFHIKSLGIFILHTGDCRAGPSLLNDPRLISALMGRSLYAIYLDTTYCAPQHTFPSQEQVIAECREFVKTVVDDRNQVRFSPIRRLVLVGSYVIGKERIALSIATVLDSKIYVDARKRSVFFTFDWPELIDRLTDDPLEASVHIVSLGILNKEGLETYLDPFYPKHFTNILAIRPTGWTGLKSATTSHDHHSIGLNGQKRTRKDALTVHSVPYSEHSSFQELADLLSAFPAQLIIPTVSNDKRDVYIRSNDSSPVEVLLYWFNLTKS